MTRLKVTTLTLAALMAVGGCTLAYADGNSAATSPVQPTQTAQAADPSKAVQVTNAPTVKEFTPVGSVKDEEDNTSIDVYNYTGVVKEVRDKDIVMTGDDGKLYSIQLHMLNNADEYKALNLKVGDRVSAKAFKALNPNFAKQSNIWITSKVNGKNVQYCQGEGDIDGMEVIQPQEIKANNNTMDIYALMRKLLQ